MRAVEILGVAVATVGALSGPVLAQQVTLREMVRANGGKPITMAMIEETAILPIAQLSKISDLVVDGQIVHLRSYMSDDETTVYTDYRIVPTRVLRSRIKNVTQAVTHQPPLLLTVHGGDIVLDGTPIKVINSTWKPITTGARFLLFATISNERENRFRATGESAGIFEVLDGQRLVSLSRASESNREVEGVAFEDIVRKIRTAPERR